MRTFTTRQKKKRKNKKKENQQNRTETTTAIKQQQNAVVSCIGCSPYARAYISWYREKSIKVKYGLIILEFKSQATKVVVVCAFVGLRLTNSYCRKTSKRPHRFGSKCTTKFRTLSQWNWFLPLISYVHIFLKYLFTVCKCARVRVCVCVSITSASSQILVTL